MAPVPDLSDTIATLAERVESLLQAQQKSEKKTRIIIALAGVPGSGKSTVSSALISRLSQDGMGNVAILPMVRPCPTCIAPGMEQTIDAAAAQDGFHYTKATLASFSNPEEAFRRRGAPFTFDAQGFVELVRRLKQMPVTDDSDSGRGITAPGFDHAVGDPVPDAIVLSSTCRAVIVEGNYTLFSQEPWSEIASLAEEKYVCPLTARIELFITICEHANMCRGGSSMYPRTLRESDWRADIWPRASRAQGKKR